MSDLYVNYNGLSDNIDELKHWKDEFNELHNEFLQKLADMNKYWQGSDYNAMRENVKTELEKITGPEGKVQAFINESTNDLIAMKNSYTDIRNKNASYWG